MLQEQNDTRVKRYGIIIGIFSLAAQHGIYLLANAIAQLVGIPPYLPKIVAIDDAIPIVSAFILPYIWSYLYWAMAPMAVSKCKLDHFLDYLASYLFSCLFGALILIFAPTYMDRVGEGLMDFSKTGFLDRLTRFWYSLDGGERAYNLLPSFHCINSTVSFLGVYKRKEIPVWFQVYSFVITILIYLSTMYVKQHFFLDVVSGVAIALVVYWASKKWHWGRVFLRPMAWWKKTFGKKAADKA